MGRQVSDRTRTGRPSEEAHRDGTHDGRTIGEIPQWEGTSGRRAGKFAGEVERFYSEESVQFSENKRVMIGREHAFFLPVGEASRGSL